MNFNQVIINDDIIFNIVPDTTHNCDFPGCCNKEIYAIGIRPNTVHKSYSIITSNFLCVDHMNEIYNISFNGKIMKPLPNIKGYSDWELAFIIDNYGKMSLIDIGKSLNRRNSTISVLIKKYHNELGLDYNPRKRVKKEKTIKIIEYIKENQNTKTIREIAKELGVSYQYISKLIKNNKDDFTPMIDSDIKKI